MEVRNVTCADCGEDFCNGNLDLPPGRHLFINHISGKACGKMLYESFVRLPELQTKSTKKATDTNKEHKKGKKAKRKGRSKSKSKRSKSKSPKKDKK